MLTRVSSKGQTVIPTAIRDMARIGPGDELDVGYVGGMIIMRKRRPLTKDQVRTLLREGRSLPEITPDDEQTVEAAIKRVRRKPGR